MSPATPIEPAPSAAAPRTRLPEPEPFAGAGCAQRGSGIARLARASIEAERVRPACRRCWWRPTGSPRPSRRACTAAGASAPATPSGSIRPFVDRRRGKPHRLAASRPRSDRAYRARHGVGGGADRLPVARRVAQHGLALGREPSRKSGSVPNCCCSRWRRCCSAAASRCGCIGGPARVCAAGTAPRSAVAQPSPPEGGDGLPDPAPLPAPRSRVVLIGDFLSPLPISEPAVGALAALPVQRPPAADARPGRDAAALSAAACASRAWNGEAEALVPRVEGIRDAYAEALAAQLQGLAALCTAAGWGFGIHRTDHRPRRHCSRCGWRWTRSIWPCADDLRRPLAAAGARRCLPLLWWLLRATPPAPRAQNFPAIRLLAGLRPREETPARTPWWLLALRVCRSSPHHHRPGRPGAGRGWPAAPGATGPVLLVIDDGLGRRPRLVRPPAAAADAVLDLAESEPQRDVRAAGHRAIRGGWFTEAH